MNLKRNEAELEPIAPISLHECRHTFASLMIAAGVNAKALSTYMDPPPSRSHSTATGTSCPATRTRRPRLHSKFRQGDPIQWIEHQGTTVDRATSVLISEKYLQIVPFSPRSSVDRAVVS